MSKEWPGSQDIDQFIIQTVEKDKPSTVEQLVKLIQLEYAVPRQEILERILNLQDQGKIVFKWHPASPNLTLKNYMLSSKSSWYWIIIAISAATTALVFTVPENAYPVVYALYALGSIFVLFLPGYALTKAFFPAKELDNIERISLSIGMSIAIVPLVGLFLNYTFWGIRTATVTTSLLVITVTFATAAIIRGHETDLKNLRTP